MEPTPIITPTRRLTRKERAVFDRVTSDFTHLQASDAEELTQYAEATVRYQVASKSTKKNPTVSTPVVNRSTGNITGEKIVRNPAFVTIREAQAQMNSLARRLMIDAHSAEKRLRLESKKARSATRVAAGDVADAALYITEAQIEDKMQELAKVPAATPHPDAEAAL